jgi:hypothetical protein
VSLTPLTEATLTKLKQITGLTVYEGDVPADPPRTAGAGSPVAHYAVLYIGPGQVSASDRYANHASTDLGVTLWVTCVSGTPRGANWVTTQVRSKLTGSRILGPQHGRLTEVTDPGPVRLDKEVPGDLRWFSPLQYRLATTT